MPIEYKTRECESCGSKTEWWDVGDGYECVRCKSK